LYPVDVRCERGDDDATLATGECLVEGRPDTGFGWRHALAVGVGRVAEQREKTFTSEPGQAGYVRRPAVDGCLVELVVTGEEHVPEVGSQHYSPHVGDRVGKMDQLDRERTGLHHFS